MHDRRWLFLPLAFLVASIANAAQPEIKSQEVFAPYWTSEPGWDTELQLKNNLAAGSLTVTPVLRLSSSQEIALDPVTIAANDTTHVSVNLGLLKHSPRPPRTTRLVRFGRISIRRGQCAESILQECLGRFMLPTQKRPI